MEIFQKSTEGQTPTLCFYIRSVFCKHLEAFLKNHPSTHIHLLLQLSVSTPQRILWCLASLGLHAAPDCYAPGLTAHQKWPPHRACVRLCTCVCLTQVILALFSQIKMLKTNDEQPNNISLVSLCRVWFNKIDSHYKWLKRVLHVYFCIFTASDSSVLLGYILTSVLFLHSCLLVV